jgi:hypothetical protein
MVRSVTKRLAPTSGVGTPDSVALSGQLFSEQVERMQSFRFHVAGFALIGVGLLGCTQNAGMCQRPTGSFHPTYSVVAGNCTQFAGRDLNLNADDQLSTVSTVNSLADSVTTEVNLVGCTVGFKQRVMDSMGVRLVSRLEGELNVEDESALSGQLSYMEYMPDGATERCRSQVEVSYTHMNSNALGTAAQRALMQ